MPPQSVIASYGPGTCINYSAVFGCARIETIKKCFNLFTVNSEIFARILFSRITSKDIFAKYKIRVFDMIYLYQ